MTSIDVPGHARRMFRVAWRAFTCATELGIAFLFITSDQLTVYSILVSLSFFGALLLDYLTHIYKDPDK